MSAALDEELEAWAQSSGYGGIDKQVPSGRSGWASFQKITVNDPPAGYNNKPVSFFVKSSSRSSDEMFHGEALGLNAMYACSQEGSDCLRIPKVYHYGDYSNGSGSFLIMEYLNLAGRSDDRTLGKELHGCIWHPLQKKLAILIRHLVSPLTIQSGAHHNLILGLSRTVELKSG